MRCDDQPDGCSPCKQNRSECVTTDRNTRKPTVRGYVQTLARCVQNLDAHVRSLEAQLTALGAEVKPFDGMRNPPSIQADDEDSGNEHASETANGPAYLNNGKNGGNGVRPPDLPDGESKALPDFRSGLMGNNYLGVSSGNSFLSSIHGTSLTVLGMEIDLADYTSPDIDEPDPFAPSGESVYNKSYYSFVQTAYKAHPKPPKVPLPDREQAFLYSEWYFRTVHPYLPMIHKPTFMALVSNPSFPQSRSMLSNVAGRIFGYMRLLQSCETAYITIALEILR